MTSEISNVTRWRYFFLYLAIYNNENEPNSIQYLPNWNCQRQQKFRKNSKICPHLVTLETAIEHDAKIAYIKRYVLTF